MKSKFDRNYSADKRKIEKEIREQIRKDAEIPEEVYESARKAYQMILDGEVCQEQAGEIREVRQEQAEKPGEVRQEQAEKTREARQERVEKTREVRQEQTEKRGAFSMFVSAAPKFAWRMAAVLAGCIFFNAAFPAQARALPIVGSIFERIQEELGYGNISEYARKLEEDAQKSEDGANIGNIMNANGENNDGLTLSCAEIYADEETIYLSMKLKSEEPFPEGFYDSKGKSAMTLYAEKVYRFMDQSYYEELYKNDPSSKPYLVQGVLVNENTFEFLWRIGLKEDLEAYRNWSGADQEESLPEKFSLSLNINSIHSRNINKSYSGSWSFRIPVTVDDSDRETIKLQETNETGAGLLSVEKTPFELTTRAITPGIVGYKVAVLDAKGNKLPCVLSNEVWADETLDNKWLLQGYDVSSVEVFVLGREFYENVYAAGLWTEADWNGNEKKSEKEKLGTLLREHADYYKMIHFNCSAQE